MSSLLQENINDDISGVTEEQLSVWRNEYRRIKLVFMVCFVVTVAYPAVIILAGAAGMLSGVLSLGLSAEIGISSFILLVSNVVLCVLAALSERKIRKYTVLCIVYLGIYTVIGAIGFGSADVFGIIGLIAQIVSLSRYDALERLSVSPGYPDFNGAFFVKQYSTRLYSDEQILSSSGQSAAMEGVHAETADIDSAEKTRRKNTIFMDEITDDDVIAAGHRHKNIKAAGD